MKDREPKPSRTASLFFAVLAAASLGLAACQRREDQGQTLPGSAAATVTPWRPDAQPTARTAPTARPQPTEAPKPAASEVKLSKKPEDLFRILLTTPLQQDSLPPKMVSKGNSVGGLDATAQAFDAIGQVNIVLAEDDPRFYGMPNGRISYTIFPKASDAKNAYSVTTQSLSNSRVLETAYPATISTQSAGLSYMSIIVTQIDNVMLIVLLTEVDQANIESKAIGLTNTALAQLAKVSR